MAAESGEVERPKVQRKGPVNLANHLDITPSKDKKDKKEKKETPKKETPKKDKDSPDKKDTPKKKKQDPFKRSTSTSSATGDDSLRDSSRKESPSKSETPRKDTPTKKETPKKDPFKTSTPSQSTDHTDHTDNDRRQNDTPNKEKEPKKKKDMFKTTDKAEDREAEERKMLKEQEKQDKLLEKQEKKRQKEFEKEDKKKERLGLNTMPRSKSESDVIDDRTGSGRQPNGAPLKQTPKTTKPQKQTGHIRAVNLQKCLITLTDGSKFETSVDRRAAGQVLFDQVCDHLDLQERDYFGISCKGPGGHQTWIDHEKKLSKQLKSSSSAAAALEFRVKFYPLYPTQLQEDQARYQMCLQIRADIVSEKLPCTFVTYALLGSYTAQSEIGDHDPLEHGSGWGYLKEIKFAPPHTQGDDLFKKIAELHKSHRGLTPEQAEFHFLENARKLEFYGVDIHTAVDEPDGEIQLGICARGLLVYKNKRQLNKFAWPQITKLSYDRNVLFVTLRPIAFEPYQRVVGFMMYGIEHAKRVWWICGEHHTFFRLKEAEMLEKGGGLLSFGSKFRYSAGRTQFQMSIRRSLSRSSVNF